MFFGIMSKSEKEEKRKEFSDMFDYMHSKTKEQFVNDAMRLSRSGKKDIDIQRAELIVIKKTKKSWKLW